MKSHASDVDSTVSSSPIRLQFLALLCATMVLWAGCGDDGITTAADGTLEITPSTLNFPGVIIGESTVETIRLINDGDTTIHLSDLELGPNPNREGLHETLELLNPWQETHRLEPGATYTLEVQYAPTASEPSEGLVTFRTNLAGMTDVSVEVRAGAPEPELLADEVVTFDRTPPGSEEWRLTEIRNIGFADLEVDDIYLSGSEHFWLTFPEGTEGDLSAPDDDADAPRDVVAPGESLPVRVFFEAPNDQFQAAQIRVETNAPNAQTHMIAVVANSDAPCLRLIGDEIDFGLASIGNTSRQTVTLHNCSRVAHTVVSEISLGEHVEPGDNFEAGGDIYFAIDEETLPEELEDGGIKAIPPDESISFVITYAPQAEQIDLATLRVVSNDEAGPLMADVRGEGAELDCPIAVANARIAGASAWSTDGWVFGIPLDVIEFDGSESYDPDETNVTYEWTLIERPMNSTAQLASPNSATPTLSTDIAGNFVVELTVYDGHGIASCEPAVINVAIEPESAIHIELTWDVPASPDGTGTDLDLHYLHPNGQWSVEPWGVFWQNTEPDWLDGSEVSLDIDDLTGELPENVNHDEPDPTYDYSTGVYYFGDVHNFGATDARVRIYLNNELVLVEEQRFHTAGAGVVGPSDVGDFWYVADILVEHGGVLDLDFVDEFREDGGFPGD